MVKQKLKKNDVVIVLCGRDKGRQGKILRVKGNKVLVENIQKVTKHIKPNPRTNQPGEKKQIETFIDISNVAIFNTNTNKADKIKFKIDDAGKKQRHFKSNDAIIDI